MTEAVIERLLGILLPSEHAEAVAGDLREERERGSLGGWPLVRSTTGIVVRLSLEPWRDPAIRFYAAATLVAGWALIIAIAWAAEPYAAAVTVWPEPAASLLARAWTAPHIGSAIAVGLAVGRLPIFSGFARPIRAQVTCLLAAVAATLTTDPFAGLAAAATLVAAALVGARAHGGEHREATISSG